ncbi:hypothetical protein [Pseudoalteromonas aurantia]|uniref:Lysozyme inhibitor LprI N-terminal domain-containing protein n=2 Tax=Pseudoalteromonas TaxID=53246 RepID=A0A5S3V862_9GAMM|nr:hypothetical protein [Pseudoalteromonas aurantia]TMO65403.1 hypothetical protein CWC18_04890 [Pseudoalteromonas aurantia]TMO67884.1 hypothetical protein CWC19_12410 [Pseudoalteromonas aurantia]TMO78241.1 hypothetical protein CWC20_02435 [Pseudoalteromonas aurantia]
MKKTKYLLTSLPCLLLSTFAQANFDILKDCDPLADTHPSRAKNYIVCLDDNIRNLERTRKTWITKLRLDMDLIEQDTGNSQLLPIIERSFIRQDNYIEDSCRWRYLHQMPNATKAAIIYKKCKIRMLKRHIEDLKHPY